VDLGGLLATGCYRGAICVHSGRVITFGCTVSACSETKSEETSGHGDDQCTWHLFDEHVEPSDTYNYTPLGYIMFGLKLNPSGLRLPAQLVELVSQLCGRSGYTAAVWNVLMTGLSLGLRYLTTKRDSRSLLRPK